VLHGTRSGNGVAHRSAGRILRPAVPMARRQHGGPRGRSALGRFRNAVAATDAVTPVAVARDGHSGARSGRGLGLGRTAARPYRFFRAILESGILLIQRRAAMRRRRTDNSGAGGPGPSNSRRVRAAAVAPDARVGRHGPGWTGRVAAIAW